MQQSADETRHWQREWDRQTDGRTDGHTGRVRRHHRVGSSSRRVVDSQLGYVYRGEGVALPSSRRLSELWWLSGG